MTALEDIRSSALVRGIAPNQSVQVVSIDWIGDQALNVVYRDQNGAVSERTLYRDDEHGLEMALSEETGCSGRGGTVAFMNDPNQPVSLLQDVA